MKRNLKRFRKGETWGVEEANENGKRLIESKQAIKWVHMRAKREERSRKGEAASKTETESHK